MEEQKHLLYGSGAQRNMAESSYQSRRGSAGEYYTPEEERGALTSRGILLVVLAALGVFGVATASSRYSTQTVAAPSGSTAMNYATIPALRTADDGPMDEPTVTSEMCAGDKSVPVLQGYDVVAYQYLTPGAPPVMGSDEFTSELYGYTFWFSSQDNKEAFDADTDKMSPMYGGFCSYGVSHEIVWNADLLGPASNPNYWFISPKGRLYIFRSATPRDEFIWNLSEEIEHANALWQGWFTGDEPYNTGCFCTDDDCADQ